MSRNYCSGHVLWRNEYKPIEMYWEVCTGKCLKIFVLEMCSREMNKICLQRYEYVWKVLFRYLWSCALEE
jgi:hypothetical protein